MSEITDKWEREAAADKLLQSLILNLTKSGNFPWERDWFGIYDYSAKIGEYTFQMLKSSTRHNSVTIYVSTEDAINDLHVDGKEVWFFLKGKRDKPDQNKLIQELTKRGNA